MAEADDTMTARNGEGEDGGVGRLIRLAGARPAPAAEVAERVRAAAHWEWRRSLRRRRWRRRRGWTGGLLTAAALLVVALTIGIGPNRGPAAPVATLARVAGPAAGVSVRPRGAAAWEAVPGDLVRQGAVVETARATRAALVLDSGASLRLDHGTRVALASASALRLERGAVYVDAPPGTVSALEVWTPRLIARERGTQFEVRLMGGEVRVRVREGAVAVSGRGGEHEAKAGQELRTAGGEVVRRDVTVHGPEWSWVLQVAPPFGFGGRSLADFLAWACRENGWTLRYAGTSAEAADRVQVHGSVEGLTPVEALGAVLPTTGFVHRVDDGVLTVERAAARARRPAP